MTPKKNPEADLDKRRSIHLETGLLVILAVTLVCFEWSTPQEEALQTTAGCTLTAEVIETMIRTPPPEKRKEEVRPQLQPILDIIPDFEPGEIYKSIEAGSAEAGNMISWIWDLPEGSDEPVKPEVYLEGLVEIKPLFPGGNDKLLPWIYGHIIYPEEPASNGIHGTVTATFVVNNKGKVVDVKIIRGVHPELDNEVIRVLGLLPDFRPAVQNGKYVSVLYSIPITFKLM